MSTSPRVMLRDHRGCRGWEIDVPGAQMVRPIRPEDPYCPSVARVTQGDCVRLLWPDAGEVIDITVGERDDSHWHALRMPVHALEDVIALLEEARDAHYRRAEDAALERRSELPAECPW